jgi:phage protein U
VAGRSPPVGILKFVTDTPRRRASSIVTVARGHRTVDQLAAEQGTGPIEDSALLRGDFWPEEDGADEFLAAIDQWREA